MDTGVKKQYKADRNKKLFSKSVVFAVNSGYFKAKRPLEGRVQ
jgi:hypothetical protein